MSKITTDIDRKTASKLLGVSIRTIDRYIRGGKLFASQQNGKIKLDKSQILNFKHEKVPVVKKMIDKAITRPAETIHVESVKENIFYKDLYGEANRMLKDYQQKLEQSNYRIGQLESQIINHPATFAGPKIIERKEDSAAMETLRRDLLERERELAKLKELIRQERSSRIVFSILTYLLLAMLPLVWFLVR